MEFSTLIGVIGVILFLIWMVDAIGGVQNTRHPSRSIDTVRFIYVGVCYEKWGAIGRLASFSFWS